MASYYDEDTMNDSSAPSEAESDEPMDKGKKSEDYTGETALLPKSILMGKTFKPGEEVIFKIVHEYDDEIEVAYATEEKKDSKKEEGMEDDSEPMKESMSKMDEAYA